MYLAWHAMTVENLPNKSCFKIKLFLFNYSFVNEGINSCYVHNVRAVPADTADERQTDHEQHREDR